MSLPSEGDLVADRYRIERAIGKGAMGAVYAVRDERSQRAYALKWIAFDTAEDPEQVKSLVKREIKALQLLQHGAILQLYDHGTTEDAFFVVTELLEGSDLLSIVEAHGPLNAAECAQVIAGLCDALAAAHAQGIVHRDVKPGNLFRRTDGRLVLLDFGIAKASSGARNDTMAQGANTVLAGTASFLAPEVLAGSPATEKSDVFSAGGTLQWLLTGKLPFTGATVLDVLKAIAANDRQPLERDDLPSEMRALIDRMLARDPAARPTASEAASALVASHTRITTVANHTQIATVAGTSPTAGPPEDEAMSWWWLAAPVVLAALVVGAWLVLRKPAPRAPDTIVAVEAPPQPALPAPAAPEQVATPTALPTPEAVKPTPSPEPALAKAGAVSLSFEHWVDVSVDGLALGRKEFNLKMNLAPGKHTIVASHPKFGQKSFSVDIKPGKTTALSIDLVKK